MRFPGTSGGGSELCLVQSPSLPASLANKGENIQVTEGRGAILPHWVPPYTLARFIKSWPCALLQPTTASIERRISANLRYLGVNFRHVRFEVIHTRPPSLRDRQVEKRYIRKNGINVSWGGTACIFTKLLTSRWVNLNASWLRYWYDQ